jgi:hypothetical protein
MADEQVTRRDALIELRDVLTAALREEVGKDLAPISRELRAVWEELDALPVPQSEAPADQLAAAREARRAAAAKKAASS